MEINVKFIKEKMDKDGLTVGDLAYRTKKKESWIYKVLAGDAGKTFKTVQDFAEALGVNPRDLIK